MGEEMNLFTEHLHVNSLMNLPVSLQLLMFPSILLIFERKARPGRADIVFPVYLLRELFHGRVALQHLSLGVAGLLIFYTMKKAGWMGSFHFIFPYHHIVGRGSMPSSLNLIACHPINVTEVSCVPLPLYQ